MYMNSKRTVTDEQNERHKRLLANILKEEGNKSCADCKTRNPTWASVNLGVFVCLTCSGIHRSLGVHISQVRSCNLDTWLPKQVEFCRVMGNVKGNRYWEARLPKDFRRPPSGNPNPELAAFIRAKYVDHVYAATDAQPPTIDNYLNHPYGSDATDSVHSPPAAPAGAAAVAQPARQDSAGRPPTKPAPPAAPALTIDLLGGFDDVPAPNAPTSPPALPASTDPFGSFVSAPPPPPPQQQQPAAASIAAQLNALEWTDFHTAAPPASASSPTLPTLPLTAPAGGARPLQHPGLGLSLGGGGGGHQRSHSISEGLSFSSGADAIANQPSRFGGHSKALSSLPPEFDQPQQQQARLHVRTPSHETAAAAVTAGGYYHPHSLSNSTHLNHTHHQHNNTNNQLANSSSSSAAQWGAGQPRAAGQSDGVGVAGPGSYGPPPDDLLAGLTIHQMMESMSPVTLGGGGATAGVGSTGASLAGEDPFQFSSSATSQGDILPHVRGGGGHHHHHHHPHHKRHTPSVKASEEILRLFDAEPSTGTAVGASSSSGFAAMDDPFGDFIGGAHAAAQNGVGHIQQPHKQQHQLLI